MNTLPETIKTKFDELLGAIHYAADDLKIAGAEASLIGDFSQVSGNIETCKKLQEFENNIKYVWKNFETLYKSSKSAKKEFNRQCIQRTRKSKGQLRVKFSNQVIEKKSIADTFVDALKVFGLERVSKLDLAVTRLPLLSKTPTNGYQAQRKIGDWYITAHVNMTTAQSTLEKISKELNIPIRLEIVK